jgi:cellulose biosynthesis protein BcsQ
VLHGSGVGTIMAVIAVYSVKGGVGKTTLASGLAWCSATLSGQATLLWDLDPQGGAGFLFNIDSTSHGEAAGIFSREVDPGSLVWTTGYEQLDLLPADSSMWGLDARFERAGRRRLADLTETLAKEYARIILDCPPGLSESSAQVLRAADLVVVPLPPSPLSRRALEALRADLARNHTHPPALLPVLSMVDGRRRLHRDAREELSGWPVIPMSSQIEQMAVRREPVGNFAGSGEPAAAFARLWDTVEQRLREG